MPYKPEYGRQVGVLLPPKLVVELDRYIVEHDNHTSRSRVIAEAIRQFLIDKGREVDR